MGARLPALIYDDVIEPATSPRRRSRRSSDGKLSSADICHVVADIGTARAIWRQYRMRVVAVECTSKEYRGEYASACAAASVDYNGCGSIGAIYAGSCAATSRPAD